MPPRLPKHDPVRAADAGVLLEVEVVPGAQEDRFPAGFNPWRGRVQARVRAQAQDGKANAALCEVVAAHFGLAPGRVQVASGATGRQKTLVLQGLGADDVRARLVDVLGPGPGGGTEGGPGGP